MSARVITARISETPLRGTTSHQMKQAQRRRSGEDKNVKKRCNQHKRDYVEHLGLGSALGKGDIKPTIT